MCPTFALIDSLFIHKNNLFSLLAWAFLKLGNFVSVDLVVNSFSISSRVEVLYSPMLAARRFLEIAAEPSERSERSRNFLINLKPSASQGQLYIIFTHPAPAAKSGGVYARIRTPFS